jgi:hypothetical protein
MSDPHQEALKRQEYRQRQLEELMQRQENQTRRDEHLKVQQEWLSKQ